METDNNKNFEKWERWSEMYHKENKIGRVLAGFFVVGIGSLLLARQAGAILPEWLFTWKMLVIAIGLFAGAKRMFRPGGWIVPILVGLIFSVDDFAPGINISHLIWPALIILFGIILIFKPRRHWSRRHWRHWEKMREAYPHHVEYQGSTEDRIDATCVFGSVKKNIISKDFKGGEVTCFFGGAEINLSQADINGIVELECTQVFGGVKLIIPPHWKIQSETTSVFGGIEDNRPMHNEANMDNSKILVLKGTCVFGGLEIISY